MTRLFPKTPKHLTEASRQQQVISYLQTRDWVVKQTEGTILSHGWPDLYVAHVRHGQRWIEMKVPGGKLRETQIRFITDFELAGVGVWVLEAATPEQYARLFKPPNWRNYL